MEKNIMLEYAGWTMDSCDDGPGIRTVLFLQGCSQNCPGCHNSRTHRKGLGNLVSLDEMVKMIEERCCNRKITISGGEPMEQVDALIPLVAELKRRGFNVCLYTSYSLNCIPHDLLNNLSYIKTGRFVASLRSAELQFVGSSNQQLYRIEHGLLEELPLCA